LPTSKPTDGRCRSTATASLDIALDAIEAAYGPFPTTGVNRIEHCTITRFEQIERMARLGIQPSFLMNHVYFYGAAYRDQLFGEDRLYVHGFSFSHICAQPLADACN
jgi:predicted amidohydrolase YtcJ